MESNDDWIKTTAYIWSPTGDGETGKMSRLHEDRKLVYRVGNNSLRPIQEGYYEVEYNRSRYMREGREVTSRHIESLHPTVPSTTEAIRETVGTITKRADKILEPLNLTTMSPEEILDEITDEGYLRGIRGIGEKTAPKLSEKFENLRPDDLDLNRIFHHHGIPFDLRNKRAVWAQEYFCEYPDDKARFEQNPYFLARIDDPRETKVRRLLAILDDASEVERAGYSLSKLDEKILENDTRWEYHAYRVKAQLMNAMDEVKRDGDTVTTSEHLLECVSRLGIDKIKFGLDERPRDLDVDTLEELVDEHKHLTYIQYQKPKGTFRKGITTDRHVRWSQEIQRAVERLNAAKKPFPIQLREKMQDSAREGVPFTLTEEQKNGVDRTFSNSLSMLTGPAGSGKTAAVQAMVNGFLRARHKHEYKDPMEKTSTFTRPYNVFLLASTGAAAKRLREGLDLKDPKTGEPPTVSVVDHEEIAYSSDDEGVLQIGTLHSFLGYRGPGLGYNLPRTTNAAIVVDEASMLDEEPVYHFMRYLNECLDDNKKVCVLKAGDINQLPPVGAGFPFRDLLGANGACAAPTTRLSEILRQKEGSNIIHASDQVKKQKVPPTQEQLDEWGTSDMFDKDFWSFQPDSSGARPIEQLLQDYTGLLKQKVDAAIDSTDVQIITPLRNPSAIDDEAYYVKGINESLQEHYADRFDRTLNKYTCASPQNPSYTWLDEFAEGDRIVHIGENGYHAETLPDGINRGSIGRIVHANPQKNLLKVQYPWLDVNVRYQQPKEVGQLNLSYAVTTHSAQGSEFDYVLAPVPKKGAPTLIDQGWLYTTITRASKHLCLVFPPRRLARDVNRNFGMERQTVLLKDVNAI